MTSISQEDWRVKNAIWLVKCEESEMERIERQIHRNKIHRNGVWIWDRTEGRFEDMPKDVQERISQAYDNEMTSLLMAREASIKRLEAHRARLDDLRAKRAHGSQLTLW